MKYAIIENNTVTNVAVAEHPLAANWIASETAAIGDLYDSETSTFIKPHPEPEPVPDSVTRLHARLALIDANLWADIRAHFDDPSRTETELAFWEDAQTWRREDATLIAAAEALGMDSAQIDALFIDASRR